MERNYKKPYKRYPCNKGANCWHLQHDCCTYLHTPEEEAAAKKKEVVFSQNAVKAAQRQQEKIKTEKDTTLVKPSIQNGLLILANDAVNRCADQVTELFRSKFTSELKKVLPELLLTTSPQDFDKKLNKALFKITAPTVTSSATLAEHFLSVMSTQEEKEENPTNIFTTPTSPNSWADAEEAHLPSDLLDQGSSKLDDEN